MLKWLNMVNFRCLGLLFICVHTIDLDQQKGIIWLFYMYALKLLAHSEVSHHYVLQIFCQFSSFWPTFFLIFHFFGTIYEYILIKMVYFDMVYIDDLASNELLIY